jgi:hypothetical protein
MGQAKRLGFVALVLAVGLMVGGTGAGAQPDSSGVAEGEGVGMYTDASTANQASTFTINRRLVSCGVGGADLAGLGPFEMLMFSTRIDTYAVDRQTKEIRAQGEMRSITRVGGQVIEDVRHPFIALALDLDGNESQPRTDRFDVHFRTPFWQPGNPLCTPSTKFPGQCRFGGVLIAGNVHVAAGHH